MDFSSNTQRHALYLPDCRHHLDGQTIWVGRRSEKVAIKGQDIADSANGVVSNVKGLTSIGGTVEMFVDKYINPKLKETLKEKKEKKND